MPCSSLYASPALPNSLSTSARIRGECVGQRSIRDLQFGDGHACMVECLATPQSEPSASLRTAIQGIRLERPILQCGRSPASMRSIQLGSAEGQKLGCFSDRGQAIRYKRFWGFKSVHLITSCILHLLVCVFTYCFSPSTGYRTLRPIFTAGIGPRGAVRDHKARSESLKVCAASGAKVATGLVGRWGNPFRKLLRDGTKKAGAQMDY